MYYIYTHVSDFLAYILYECTMHSYRYIVMPSICLVVFVALAHMLARAAFCNLYCVVVVVVAVAADVADGNTDAWIFGGAGGGGWC